MVLINQERVREMTKLAAYESRDGKKYRPVTRYFRSDFVGKHLLKGFIAGTFAFCLMLALWIVCHLEALAATINQTDWMEAGVAVLIRYVVFMLVYLVGIDIYANLFYEAGKRSTRWYLRHLKRLDRFYKEQENRYDRDGLEEQE